MLVTRLELFLRSRNLPPAQFARLAAHSRQHLLRMRQGSLPTKKSVIDVVDAARAATHEDIPAGMLFERGDALLASDSLRLAQLHAADLAALAAAIERARSLRLLEAVRATGVHSETAVVYLLQRGREQVDEDPGHASDIFATAMLMTSSLDVTPPELRAALAAEASKRRANALGLLGDYDAALADLAAGARLFATARFCEREAGEVEYTRATILFKREQWIEASSAARRAKKRFLAARDARRAAHAEIVEAGALAEEGNIDAARTIFHRLRRTLDALRDRDALARVWLNVAICDIRGGDSRSARTWLNRASATFRQRGTSAEFLRTRWTMGSYFARFGERKIALRLFDRVARAFGSLGMHAEAGCVGLERLEVMLNVGTSAPAIAEQARAIMRAFASAGLRVSMARAFELLRTIHVAPNPAAVLADLRSAPPIPSRCRPLAPLLDIEP